MGGLSPPWTSACSLGHVLAQDHVQAGPWQACSGHRDLCTLEQTAVGDVGEWAGRGAGRLGAEVIKPVRALGLRTKHLTLSSPGPFIEHRATPSPEWGLGAAKSNDSLAWGVVQVLQL